MGAALLRKDECKGLGKWQDIRKLFAEYVGVLVKN
jgi:hypothetical protein